MNVWVEKNLIDHIIWKSDPDVSDEETFHRMSMMFLRPYKIQWGGAII